MPNVYHIHRKGFESSIHKIDDTKLRILQDLMDVAVEYGDKKKKRLAKKDPALALTDAHEQQAPESAVKLKVRTTGRIARPKVPVLLLRRLGLGRE
jgi:hypothetical protein